jgi:CrcB protein
LKNTFFIITGDGVRLNRPLADDSCKIVLGDEAMGTIFLIGIGGFLGAVCRYWISGLAQNLFRSVDFPYGTLAVNVIGCFVIGFLTYLVEFQSAFNPGIRMTVLIGMLGAFTTFSTFSQETINLVLSGEITHGMANILLNNALGLAAVWFGRSFAFWIWR